MIEPPVIHDQPTPGVEVPPPSADFFAKRDYYRSQHRTAGIRATHLVGIPTVAFALPLVVARPRVGLPLFAAGWALQVAGHRVFEKNSPALANGPVSYQLVGLAYWAEEVVDLIAGLNARRQRRGGRASTSAATQTSAA